MGTGHLGWSAFLLCVAMIVWSATGAVRRIPMIAFVVTALVMFAGIGLRRELFGSTAAGWPRYQYMAAMMIVAPVLAVGLGQARRFAPWARWIPRAILLVALVRNAAWMGDGGDYWSGLAEDDRRSSHWWPARTLGRRCHRTATRAM